MNKSLQIPSSWQWSTMGEVAEIVGGGTPKTDRADFFGGAIPWITPADLSGYTEKFISHGSRNITQAGLEYSGARLMPAGTVLFSSRAPIGYVAIAANPVSTSQGFKSFILRGGLLPDFVYYYLQHAKNLAVELASGTTFLEISGKKAAQIPIPIAPLQEQQRIVAEIEKQFTRLEAGAVALQRLQSNLKRYRAAVLKAACEGRLVPTEADLANQAGRSYESASHLLNRILKERHQRSGLGGKYVKPKEPRTQGLSTLPKGWTWATFEQLSERVTVGHVGSMKHEYVKTGIPFLRSQNVRENRFDPEGLLYISSEFHQKLSKSTLRPGDLVVVRSGSVGVTCVIPATLSEANCSDLVLIQRPLGLVPQYGAYYMNSLAKRHVEEGKVGIALTHFNTRSVAALPVPLPPLAEQERIVAEVERQLSAVEDLESVVSVNLRRVMRLRYSILQQAFSGDLVAQVPEEGSAVQLIQKIKEERQQAITAKRRPQGPKLKIMQPKPVQSLTEMLERLETLGGSAEPERLLAESYLGDDVDKFFELLREGRNLGVLSVPTGTADMIRRNDNAN
jgi:type I restriction enzyme S subunit